MTSKWNFCVGLILALAAASWPSPRADAAPFAYITNVTSNAVSVIDIGPVVARDALGAWLCGGLLGAIVACRRAREAASRETRGSLLGR